MTDKIVNDSVRLNNLLIKSTEIKNKDLISEDYHGEVTLIFKDGMLVHMTKKQGVKLD